MNSAQKKKTTNEQISYFGVVCFVYQFLTICLNNYKGAWRMFGYTIDCTHITFFEIHFRYVSRYYFSYVCLTLPSFIYLYTKYKYTHHLKYKFNKKKEGFRGWRSQSHSKFIYYNEPNLTLVLCLIISMWRLLLVMYQPFPCDFFLGSYN